MKITGTMIKACVGNSNCTTVNLNDGVSITPSATMQGNGWAAFSLLVKSGPGFATSGTNDILLTATGYTDNHRMVWQSGMGPTDLTSSVNTNWGQTPTLVEGIPAVINLPFNYMKVTVWALDASGNHTTVVPVAQAGSGSTFTISRSYQTPWYEISTTP